MAQHIKSGIAGLNGRAAEWLCAGIMLSWGVTLAIDGDMQGSLGLSGLRRFGANPDFWMWLLGVAGLVRIAALAINGRWPRTPLIRMIGAAFGVMVWLQLSWLFFAATRTSGPTSGIGVYAILALGELSSIYRAAHDARYHHA